MIVVHEKVPRRLMRTTTTVFEGKQRTFSVWRNSGPREGLPWALVYPTVDELNETNGTKLRVVGPHLAEHLVSRKEFGERLLSASYFLVDSALFFEKGSKPIGKSIVSEFKDGQGNKYEASLRYTGMYEGREGIALVVIGLSTADFSVHIPEIGGGNLAALLTSVSISEITEKIRRGDTYIQETHVSVSDDRLIEVPRFEFWGSNWAPLHLKTMIPHVPKSGEEVGSLRRLCLKRGKSSVGPQVRGVGPFGYGVRENIIGTNNGISAFEGVVLEVPKTDLQKLRTTAHE